MQRTLFPTLLSLLLGMSGALSGCTGAPPDDDDATADDDDATADDDDATEDNEFEVNGISFGGALTVVAPSAARGAGDDDDSASTGDDDDSASTGDDDDSASTGDDDDSAATGDDDDSAPGSDEYTVAMQYTFTYWADIQNGIQNCTQRIELDGTAQFGFGTIGDGSCNNCTGLITLDSSTAVDVSNPASDPDDCDPAVLAAANLDFGSLLINTTSDTAYGDFLTMGLMDVATHEALGIDWAVNGGYTAPEVTADLAGFGLTYTHTGLVNNTEGTLADASGLATVANNAGAGSSWYGYWSAFLNPELNPHLGSDMNGDYGLQATWIITF